MFDNSLGSVRRGLPTLAIAGVLVAVSATSGATAAFVITGNDIKNGTITSKDIKNETLKSKDVKDGTLRTKDLKASTVDDLKGATGPAGAPGVSGYQLINASVPIAADAGATVEATCPAGKKVLSAAAHMTASFDGTAVDIDAGTTKATAKAWNYETTADTLSLDLICANVS
ncbi:hypothetical protein [Nocardioides pinisoli]|uniref:Uncharacterized protein n=1 Tax=Nocardioides pinisoli TaxID=2950279 RepID=A0ABT1KW30_9ACTN|nr:hypothetical protein [Nocardioides pinisoli]MCP3420816.1 hypothetical protein [Nocardioides pinisoli]